ncbi:MAG: SDR family NAD(P)-dependent oxidoreductase [Gammaproteobacteria bacterium]|nr:SDR family NAD(P)-dependent oxidoreductase [Gammaproteobacteria bacterium]
MNLHGKVCVITGAASGIGAACAQEFARRGAKVCVADINDSGAREVASALPDGLAVTCDVGSEVEINQLVARCTAQFGPIDVFFSNAGIASGGDPLTSSIEDWNRQWNINVMAHVFAVRAVLPSMLERESGYLLHTASMAGILTTHGNATYATTKHAVVGLAEWNSITYHDKGVRTSLLAPLGVNTPMLGNSRSAFATNAAGTIREPEEVADMVVNAMDEERFLILTDDIAQTWMDRKASDLERWLRGMRRLQQKIEDARSKGH